MLPPHKCQGCKRLVSGTCHQCAIARRQRFDRQRVNADVRRLYKTKRWYAYRDQKRKDDPLCRECRSQGLLVLWTDLDHIQPHRGDLDKFWDYTNLAGLCQKHHAEKTARGE